MKHFLRYLGGLIATVLFALAVYWFIMGITNRWPVIDTNSASVAVSEAEIRFVLKDTGLTQEAIEMIIEKIAELEQAKREAKGE